MVSADVALSVGGLVAGAVGAIAGVWALYFSWRAKQASGDANDLARGSNTIALDARKIAIEANQYSQRAEDRETERHDVYWDGTWVTDGVYRVYKRGRDAAHDIVATVTVDRYEKVERAALMEDERGWIDFHFPAVAEQRAQKKRDDAAARRRAAEAVAKSSKEIWPLSAMNLSYTGPAQGFQLVTERVEWTTDRGTPRLHTDSSQHLI